MNNDNKPVLSKAEGITPKYRFPAFKDDGNWGKYRIGDYMQPYTGLSGKSGNDFGSGKSYISYKQVFDGSNIKNENCPLVKIDKSENQNKVEYGDVLITTSSETANEVGYTNVITTKLNDDIYLNSFCFGLRPIDLNFPNVLFSKYLFKNNEYRNAVVLLAQGVTRYNISKTKVVELKLSIPNNPAEQQKIAACLNSLDDVIAGHEEKLTVLEEHKKGLMQNLFPQGGETQPKYRFPEFENDEDWVEKIIIDTADKNIKWSFTGGPFGSNLKSSDYTSSGIRIIQLQNIGDGIFNDEYKIYTSLEKADELLSCNIYSGDIILSKMGDPVGRACIMPGDNERFVMASDGIRLAVNEKKFSKYFIFSLINSDIIRTKIEAKSTGSTRKRIGLDVLKQIPLLIPKTLDEQQKIASVLSSVDELIVAQREKIAALKEHKKGLMQGLFPKIES